MPFRERPINPKTGERGSLKRIPDKPEFHNTENIACGVCGDSGRIAEFGQESYCNCSAGVAAKAADLHLHKKPKISLPPDPHVDQLSAFDTPRPDQDEQLKLFDN